MTTVSTRINWYGMWTLYKKEVRRFLKVYNQTLVSPMITALLFLAVFSLALRQTGSASSYISDISFQSFMAPGLIMMTLLQNAFANSSSSMTMGKVLGSIVDMLIPPLSPGEITFAMTLAAMTRGIMAGAMVAIGVSFFVPLEVHDWSLLITYLLLASALMSLAGLLAGIYAEGFDQMSAVTSYVITPFTFLSGTFYSVKQLPELWQYVNLVNPFFYAIDGFRYSMTGHTDGNITLGLSKLILINIILYAVAWWMLKKGYRIKS